MAPKLHTLSPVGENPVHSQEIIRRDDRGLLEDFVSQIKSWVATYTRDDSLLSEVTVQSTINRPILTEVIRNRQENLLVRGFPLATHGFYSVPDHNVWCQNTALRHSRVLLIDLADILHMKLSIDAIMERNPVLTELYVKGFCINHDVESTVP
ncbi:hypothetical protein P3342_006431 [Pyrenophora teres f. teres]|uniref:Uncharacterized protein n=1 Tax=Pyrenophora teres f. teres TaxID=97479 RepID=A0A6S6W1N9_9PLEO|nr:hypothetical protein P3342_006431 [Pyrenophora teres f. teres]CAE7030706.1 hypothetical protein PTTW11_04625 [Pyrenophora teres f. teres]